MQVHIYFDSISALIPLCFSLNCPVSSKSHREQLGPINTPRLDAQLMPKPSEEIFVARRARAASDISDNWASITNFCSLIGATYVRDPLPCIVSHAKSSPKSKTKCGGRSHARIEQQHVYSALMTCCRHTEKSVVTST
jgi:hypothetical protein